MSLFQTVAFRDRAEAGRKLADRLSAFAIAQPLILAIPRGAVPMARIIADELGGDLDVLLVHKIGAPGQPELAVGSVDEFGEVYLSPAARFLRLDDSYIACEKDKQLDHLRERRKTYTELRPPIDPAGRTVIVVDDGIATGATMIAGLRAIRAKGPKTLVAAAGVASPDTLERVAGEADEVVCLLSPPDLAAVGQYFEDFSQVGDDEVAEILCDAGKEARRRTSRTRGG